MVFSEKKEMNQPRLRWLRLDNAAKVYPAARRRDWTNVFRVSATLKEPVDPAVLQAALDIIDALMEQDYRIVSVAELIQIRRVKLKPGQVYTSFPKDSTPIK